MNDDPLLNQLRQFAEKLSEKNIRLIIGGGYGLLLKSNHIQRIGVRTRLEPTPVTRSTGDIDVFLTAEVIIDKEKTTLIREVLDELGYSPVPGAEYYQFFREVKVGGVSRKLKFDFLAAPVTGEEAKLVRMDDRRIKPRNVKGFHAHTAPEALTIEEHLIAIGIGDAARPIEIFVPHPFSYVLLKLFALRDQLDDPKKDFGRYHAFDIYSAWAMMTEQEFGQAEELRETYANVGVMPEAVQIAHSLFADENSKGMIRLKEHARVANVEVVQIDEFIKDIRTLFVKAV